MQTIPITPTDRVFVLTGAGISAESGLPTFRASDGLWAGHEIEDVCTPEAWKRNPALVWEFYSGRRADGAKAEPNPAHFALAQLEAQLAGRFFLCTQNVDDLHERAGSVRLVHMHGELNKARCSFECGRPPVEDQRVYASLKTWAGVSAAAVSALTLCSLARFPWRWIASRKRFRRPRSWWW
jgi:NAD-dependent deacetylase